MKKLRVVFMGTPEFAVPILKALLENVNVVLVVSQPDKEVGRKRLLTPSPVKTLALEHNVEVFTPINIRENYNRVIETKPDMIVTCAYGQIIPKMLLDAPRLGCINVHASLLPKFRGGAPIHRAIMEGEEKTGITIMYMDEHMDSGDIIKQESTPIENEDTLETLSDKLKKIGSRLLIETIPSIIEGTNERIKQKEDEVSFGFIIKKEDEYLDFNRTSKEIYNHIRGLNPNPGAHFILMGKRMKVYSSRIGDKEGEISKINNIYEDGIGIGTVDGEIIITEIKPEGKNRVLVRDYLNGINKNSLKGVVVNERED